MFTIAVINSSTVNIMKQLNAFPKIYCTFMQMYSSTIFFSFHRSPKTLEISVFLIFETELSLPRSSFSVYVYENTEIYSVYFLVGSAGLIRATVPRTTWITKVTKLQDIILGSAEHTGWEIAKVYLNNFYENSEKLERYVNNCSKRGVTTLSEIEILQLSTTEHRKACRIVHLWNFVTKNCSSGARCGLDRVAKRLESGKHGSFKLLLEFVVRGKNSRYVLMTFRTATLSIKFVSCGQTLMSARQFDELFKVFDVHTWGLLLAVGIFYLVANCSSFHVSKRATKQVLQNREFETATVILSFTRILVEQGSAIKEVKLGLCKQSRRIFLASILLASIY